MDLVVYGGLCRAGAERKLAYRLLALALEREAGLGELPAIEREAGGKPFFPGFPQLQFNLSHSRGAAVCALHHLPVGVDVERLRQPPRRKSRRPKPPLTALKNPLFGGVIFFKQGLMARPPGLAM